MKAFAVLAPHTAAKLTAQPATLPVYRTEMHGTPISFALVDQPDIDFAADDPAHAESVLVRVHAFSCNYREKARFLGIARQPEGRGYLVIGSEFAGTVVKVGPAVRNFHVGDPVCGNGSVEAGQSHLGLTTQRASAELQIHHCDKLFRLPAGMSFNEGAAFSIGAQTAYSMVNRLPTRVGEHIAVTAASSNTSLFAIKALLARGHTVHAITTSPGIVGELQRIGVDRVCVLPRSPEYGSALRGYLADQGLAGFDAVVDPFCDVYLRKLLPVLRRFGSYVTCGVFEQFAGAGDDQFAHHGLSVGEVFSLLIRKSIHLIGNNLGTSADLEQAAADYLAGRLHIELDTVVDDGSLQTLVERSYLAPNRAGKVVFDYGTAAATHANQANHATDTRIPA